MALDALRALARRTGDAAALGELAGYLRRILDSSAEGKVKVRGLGVLGAAAPPGRPLAGAVPRVCAGTSAQCAVLDLRAQHASQCGRWAAVGR